MSFSCATILDFRRALCSPGAHKWQCRHKCAFSQPWGFQNHAHGLHSPRPCRAEPTESTWVCATSFSLDISARETGAVGFVAAAFGVSFAAAFATGIAAGGLAGGVAESIADGGEAAVGSATFVGSAATARRAVRRVLCSPGGQMWQWRQSWPFWQPCGFQNHAHGLHSPAPWRAEPSDKHNNDASAPKPGGATSDASMVRPGGGPTAAKLGGGNTAEGETRAAEGVTRAPLVVCVRGDRRATRVAMGAKLKPGGGATPNSSPPFSDTSVLAVSMLRAASLVFLRVLCSPSGHKWQCKQSWPL